MNYDVRDEYPQLTLNKKLIINTLNPQSYCVASKDQNFKCALRNSDLLLPDGVGIVIAAKFLTGKKIKRITGSDIHEYLLRHAESNQLRVYYLGSNNETLTKIKSRIAIEYPNINCKYYSPPYKDEFNDQENSEIIQAIQSFKPDILFVGMTAPKQEKWVYKNKNNINSVVICSIGAVFDYYAGTIKRPSKIWIELGLEWLIRFIRDPKRLWRRNIISTPIFIYEVIKTKVFKKNDT